LGDSRKYPYPTTGGISEFRGRRAVSWTGILNITEGVTQVMGITQFGIRNAWGEGFSSEFPEGEDSEILA